MHRLFVFITLLTWLVSPALFAHQLDGNTNTAHYLGNEAVLIISDEQKVLFDPFFHKDFGFYQKVPPAFRKAIFKGEAPYDNIDVIVISHAHDDHFSATDVLRYLQSKKEVQLVAPQQAIDALLALDTSEGVEGRFHPVQLDFGQQPTALSVANVDIEAVRIPHAGWPGRAEVQNMVYRLTFENGATVMHMGDADPDTDHYLPFNAFWDLKPTNIGFPPYWFLQSAEGNYILKDVIDVEHSVGVHVPVKVPNLLIKSGEDFFSSPGETRHF